MIGYFNFTVYGIIQRHGYDIVKSSGEAYISHSDTRYNSFISVHSTNIPFPRKGQLHSCSLNTILCLSS